MSGPVDSAIQTILFTLFAGLTGILQAITGPTYQNLLVPELAPGALYPPFPGGPRSFYSAPVEFSNYLVVHLVDPAIVLIAIALGLLYLARSFLGREGLRFEGALPRLVVYVVLENVTVPVAGAILDLAGSVYPLIAGFDGGAWQNWTDVAGAGTIAYSFDNGALAFVLSFVLFSLVLLLTIAVALRDAILALLIVVLPALTLVGAVPPLRPLARRAWLLFGEAAFLPCLLVIPLELAVGSTSLPVVVAYLTLALASPALLSMAGTQLTQLGVPGASGVLAGGVQRGLSTASLAMTSYVRPLAGFAGSSSAGGKALGGLSSVASSAGRSALPVALPLAFGELLGHGAGHLIRHLSPHLAAGHRASAGGKGRSIGLNDPIYRRFPPRSGG